MRVSENYVNNTVGKNAIEKFCVRWLPFFFLLMHFDLSVCFSKLYVETISFHLYTIGSPCSRVVTMPNLQRENSNTLALKLRCEFLFSIFKQLLYM